MCFSLPQARQDILDRAKAMGLDWWGMVEELKQWDGWGPLLKEVTDPLVDTPEYYKQPFHGYDQGNLSWEAAFEVTAAAISVHSFVMDPKRKVMDPEGDLNLRKSYGEAMQALLSKVPARKVKDILDIGCSTGLSSKELLRTFPSAKVTGIDLSPYFLAVARHEQMQQLEKGSKKEPIAYVHAAAERTGLPNACMDLVSICLVLHELPGDATKAVIAEAHRILRPRGILAIMEMNPWSERFERVLNNPFAYAGFKSTEPYLNEYINLDLHAAIQERGFQPPSQVNSSPAHFTLVAMKQ
ncbi:unnamed protein product [Ostreobium quekettii]|uniref:Methyltransferase type 11 domain-containing protein n=1 Tax=Ostreobium quekettii TaxID=121088 RepID=A0A8S1IRF0_9CHLO|nr:unnamed protein product [Ostreobium quekettii]